MSVRKLKALSKIAQLLLSCGACEAESQCDENIVVRAHEQRGCYLMLYNAAFIAGYLIPPGRVGVLLLGLKLKLSHRLP